MRWATSAFGRKLKRDVKKPVMHLPSSSVIHKLKRHVKQAPHAKISKQRSLQGTPIDVRSPQDIRTHVCLNLLCIALHCFALLCLALLDTTTHNHWLGELTAAPWLDGQTQSIMIQYSHTKADLTQQLTTIEWESRLQHRDPTQHFCWSVSKSRVQACDLTDIKNDFIRYKILSKNQKNEILIS